MELMKAALLIIDDFLDHSEERNGLPSLYAKHGPEQAVLIGEILKSSAFLAFMGNIRNLKKVPDTAKDKSIKLFEETYRTICCGQLEDIRLQSEPLNEDSLNEERILRIIEKTTAVFIQLSVILGGILRDLSPAEINALGDYGLNLGLAYQLRDDVLDLIGTPDLTGKPYAGDLREKKKRLPLIYGWKVASESQRSLMIRIFKTPTPLDEEDITRLSSMLRELEAVEYCIEKTKEHCREAVKSLGKVSSSDMHHQLEDVANVLATFEGFEDRG